MWWIKYTAKTYLLYFRTLWWYFDLQLYLNSTWQQNFGSVIWLLSCNENPFYISFFIFAEEHEIIKRRINLLNRFDDPCVETEVPISIQECIRKGFEKNLSCIIPEMISGEALAPNGGLKRLCSGKEDFQNYKNMYESLDLSISEDTLLTKYGCIASCQETNEMNPQLWLHLRSWELGHDKDFKTNTVLLTRGQWIILVTLS